MRNRISRKNSNTTNKTNFVCVWLRPRFDAYGKQVFKLETGEDSVQYCGKMSNQGQQKVAIPKNIFVTSLCTGNGMYGIKNDAQLHNLLYLILYQLLKYLYTGNTLTVEQ
jgi:hypothetical protein